jgi:hypothetical protein
MPGRSYQLWLVESIEYPLSTYLQSQAVLRPVVVARDRLTNSILQTEQLSQLALI